VPHECKHKQSFKKKNKELDLFSVFSISYTFLANYIVHSGCLDILVEKNMHTII